MSKKSSTAAPGMPGGGPPVPKMRRGGLRQYFVDVGREMKKVTWPPYTETNRLTGVVLAVCALMMGALIAFHEVFSTLVTLLTKSQ
jgi:preprotein translocase SecE subunit